MRMKIEDISALAKKTLAPKLTPLGFEDIEVAPYIDSHGEDALKVTVRLPVNSPTVPGAISLDVMSALSRALLDQDEDRFPYLEFDHQDPYDRDVDEEMMSPSP